MWLLKKKKSCGCFKRLNNNDIIVPNVQDVKSCLARMRITALSVFLGGKRAV